MRRMQLKTPMKMKKIKCSASATKPESVKRKTQSLFAGAINPCVIGALLIAVISFACTPRSLEKPKAVPTPIAAEDKQSAFESQVENMRIANLEFIFVFRRADGGALDADDKKYLRANLPFNNRIYLADEDKALIVGSNYKFPPENVEALRARFNIEDYSAPAPPNK